MRFTAPAIVVALRPHGEVGAVVRLMTAEHGLQAAYVRGARGRRMRPVLLAGNVVEASLAARTEGQLAQATVELVHSRAPLLGEPLPAAAIDWACALTAIRSSSSPLTAQRSRSSPKPSSASSSSSNRTSAAPHPLAAGAASIAASSPSSAANRRG